jgi:hypothetical protein
MHLQQFAQHFHSVTGSDLAIRKFDAAVPHMAKSVEASQVQQAHDEEHVHEAALLIGDRMYVGTSHGAAAKAAMEAGVPKPKVQATLLFGPNQQGYKTSAGRFVTRSEAAEIAKKTGKLKYPSVAKHIQELESGDHIWPGMAKGTGEDELSKALILSKNGSMEHGGKTVHHYSVLGEGNHPVGALSVAVHPSGEAHVRFGGYGADTKSSTLLGYRQVQGLMGQLKGHHPEVKQFIPKSKTDLTKSLQGLRDALLAEAS